MLLETERLLIRSFEVADVEPYSRIVADQEVMRFLTGRAESYDEAKQYIEECIASERDRGYSRYAVLLKSVRQLIGFCGFKWIDKDIDFGWRYARKFWGTGYGTEAARAVLRYGLVELKLPRIVAVALPENIGSIRIMQKIGLRRDGCGDWDGRRTVRFVGG
jgi:RimJ/RimL family protein N-acetyltransferase